MQSPPVLQCGFVSQRKDKLKPTNGDFYYIYVTTVSNEQDWDCYIDYITPVYTTEKTGISLYTLNNLSDLLRATCSCSSSR
jgi:hypothetical protein